MAAARGDGDASGTATRRRLLLAALAGVLPWVVVTFDGGWYPVFSAGFAYTDPVAVVTLPGYLERVQTVPPRLTAWPTAVLLYGLALGTAVLDHYVGLDSRVPAGLLFLAGVNVGVLSVALSRQAGVLALPVGAVWLWAAVWLGYGDALLGRATR